MIDFKISGTVVKQIGSYQAVADSLNYLVLNFDFSSDWQGCAYIYIFTTNRADGSINYSQRLSGIAYTVPGAMITAPGFTFGLVGYDADDNIKITSQLYEVAVKKSGVNKAAVEPTAEEKSVFDQVVSDLDIATDKLRYIFIKWAAQAPAADADLLDTPNAYLGIYCGAASTAPTVYTAYNWYKVKGEAGVGIQSIVFKAAAAAGNVYTITTDDNQSYEITAPKGADGVNQFKALTDVYLVNYGDEYAANDFLNAVQNGKLLLCNKNGSLFVPITLLSSIVVFSRLSAADMTECVTWKNLGNGSSWSSESVTLAQNSAVVHNTGDETIAGVKTFSERLTADKGLLVANNKSLQLDDGTNTVAVTVGGTGNFPKLAVDGNNIATENYVDTAIAAAITTTLSTGV